MWSDRLECITKCMEELARIRSTFGTHHPEATGIEIGELDQLEELHRLLYEGEVKC